MKHFKLTTTTKQFNGRTLYQIEATIDSLYARKGQLGGFVESEANLSDQAWVSGNARVFGDAWVYGNARVCDSARVSGNALVYGDARVHGDALVYGEAQVFGSALVCGDARVYGSAQVYGDALVHGDAHVSGNARVCGDAKVTKYGECIVINNLKNTITVMPNLITIGCKSYKNLEDFLGRYKQDGAENGYSEAEMELARKFVSAAFDHIGINEERLAVEKELTELEMRAKALREKLNK